MRFRGFLLCLILVSAFRGTPSVAADTTYGETRAVPRDSRPSSKPSQSGDNRPESGDHGREEDEPRWSGGSSGFSLSGNSRGIHACFDVELRAESLGGVAGAIVLMPFWFGVCSGFYGLFVSHVHLFSGWADMESWDDRRWRFGFGFSLSAAIQPGLAGGAVSSLNLEAARSLTRGGGGQVRMRAGISGGFLSPRADFERTVFADGVPVGVQYDALRSYTQNTSPFFAEYLWQPGRGNLYLSAGAGAVILRESLEFDRFPGTGGDWLEGREDRIGIFPALSAGLGRYGGGFGNGRYWRFEIRYQATIYRPTRTSSFPSDNGAMSHGLGWDWAWLW